MASVTNAIYDKWTAACRANIKALDRHLTRLQEGHALSEDLLDTLLDQVSRHRELTRCTRDFDEILTEYYDNAQTRLNEQNDRDDVLIASLPKDVRQTAREVAKYFEMAAWSTEQASLAGARSMLIDHLLPRFDPSEMYGKAEPESTAVATTTSTEGQTWAKVAVSLPQKKMAIPACDRNCEAEKVTPGVPISELHNLRVKDETELDRQLRERLTQLESSVKSATSAFEAHNKDVMSRGKALLTILDIKSIPETLESYIASLPEASGESGLSQLGTMTNTEAGDGGWRLA